MSFSVNRSATPYLNHVGQEKTPVFILDNFLENLSQDLLYNVDKLGFEQATTYYPGIRARLPEEYILSVARALVPLIQKIYSIPTDYQLEFFDSYYSLVTAKPDELLPEQQIPHFDGADKYRFALLHYLNPNPHGGTAFFRHNITGLERVYETQTDAFLSSVSKYYGTRTVEKTKYIDSSNTHFTKIGEIPYVPNRMAIYPGNLLHSGMINPDIDIDASPVSGRLTANIFLNFVPR